MYRLLLIVSLTLSTSLNAATGRGLVGDNTVGTLVTLQDQTHAITGGTAQGGNLLHSFREFNVETGQTADFQAAADTQNIISRVTGASNSWIDGKIQSTTSEANLYLINPNGIVMGENASLDVKGAFHATTADYVTLADGQRIYADADQGLTLTVAAPEAFGFMDASVGKIQINGSQLRVADGQVVSLVGGEIGITSGAKLQAAGGRIDLAGIASAGEVKPTTNGIANTTITKADISLTDSTVTVDNHANSKTVGTIRAQGANIIANNSRLWADNNSAVDAVGHSVELSATGDIRFTGSEITAIVNSSGKGGLVSLDADNNQIAFQGADIFVDADGTGANAGDAGGLTLKSRDIRFTDVAQLSAVTQGSGQGGDVTLIATGKVYFAGENDDAASGIFVRTAGTEDNAGASGKITIQAQDIEFADGADISATTDGPGQGGSVSLDAGNQIAFQGAGIFVDADGTGANAGDAGDLTLKARDIRFTDVAQLSAVTEGSGQGGDVTLIATGQVYFAGRNDASTTSSGIFVRTAGTEDNAGAGGKVTLQAQDIEFADGARISATTGGPGQGGAVFLQASQQIRLGRDALLSADSFGAGAAGDLSLQAANLVLAGATISSGSEFAAAGAGSAGNLRILTSETIQLSGGSALTTESENAGGGGIHIETRDRLHLQDSKITTSVKGGVGQGGNIFIDPVFVILENSQIQANAHGGPGGNITLIADYLLYSGPTAIEASSALSTPGNINVQAVAVDAGSLQVTDTPDPLDVTQWAQVPCHRYQGKVSRLTMAGYDAHPTPMDDLLSSLPLRALRPTEPLSVPISAVHQTPHNLLAATHPITGCSRL
jgi:filamentous hemagglutinin family protein